VRAVGEHLARGRRVDREHRAAPRERLEQHVAERVGLRREEEHVGRGVGGAERGAREPAREHRPLRRAGAAGALVRAVAADDEARRRPA
jgi:hypothetical protein